MSAFGGMQRVMFEAFNTPLEMLSALVSEASCRWCSFQYSIGDAGGSCVWFLWVFKFLCRRVWVSAAAC